MKSVLFFLAVLFSSSVFAQAYPSKPIKIIVPFTPGSATDVMARIVGERLNTAWGQPVIVENKPGAGGTIGIRDTARADPDGYTLVVVSSGHAVNHVLYKDLGYDTLKDLSTVAMLGSLPSVLIVPPTLPVNSVKELVAMLKAKPGQYNYATAGVGSGAHVSLAKFNVATGVQAVHVPLKGTPPILAETMAGRVEYAMVPAVSGMGPVRDGKVKPLAVTTSKRVAALPNVPTLGEAGFPEGESTFWLALLAPVKTPPRDRGQGQRRGEPRVEISGDGRAPGEARHRADVHDPGRGRRLHPPRIQRARRGDARRRADAAITQEE